ncbi:hypothetical protein BKA70DRAFT_1324201 [Coprinopsis sp. MPI-PUGE-AT-0042]|nr:hypothetical protein BKA70DRAFT_1324201 [Coprinopsis sp. MPI-PUGE-AT-0042]
MSSLATVALRNSRLSITRRSAHGQVRHIHPGPNWHLPFNFTTTTNRKFAVKCLAYMGTGFSLPFVAIWWHWNRPGGLNASH